ncbi:hypothetical protein IT570_11845 [Candidatus Sumerlaeota bacterium]|nr:hypothetical protein [Candidatus Sumerlaeota bacterium]
MNPNRETPSMRPIPWRNILISAIAGILLLGGVYMSIRMNRARHEPAPRDKHKAVAVRPPQGTTHPTRGTRGSIKDARAGLDTLVAAARRQLENAHAVATGPKAEKLRAQIEETRTQIEQYSYKGAEKAGEALSGILSNSREIATSLRESGRSDIANNVEKTILEWKDGAARLLDEGREVVAGNDIATTR